MKNENVFFGEKSKTEPLYQVNEAVHTIEHGNVYIIHERYDHDAKEWVYLLRDRKIEQNYGNVPESKIMKGHQSGAVAFKNIHTQKDIDYIFESLPSDSKSIRDGHKYYHHREPQSNSLIIEPFARLDNDTFYKLLNDAKSKNKLRAVKVNVGEVYSLDSVSNKPIVKVKSIDKGDNGLLLEYLTQGEGAFFLPLTQFKAAIAIGEYVKINEAKSTPSVSETKMGLKKKNVIEVAGKEVLVQSFRFEEGYITANIRIMGIESGTVTYKPQGIEFTDILPSGGSHSGENLFKEFVEKNKVELKEALMEKYNIAPSVSKPKETDIEKIYEAAKEKALLSCPITVVKEIPKSKAFTLAHFELYKREPQNPITVTYYKKIKAWWYSKVMSYADWQSIIPMLSDEKMKENAGTNYPKDDEGIDIYYRALRTYYEKKEFYIIYDEDAQNGVKSTPSVTKPKAVNLSYKKGDLVSVKEFYEPLTVKELPKNKTQFVGVTKTGSEVTLLMSDIEGYAPAQSKELEAIVPYWVELSSASNLDYMTSDRGVMEQVMKIKGQTYFPANNLLEAKKLVQEFIREYELGGGNFTGGRVVDTDFKFVARISYNGRIWAQEGDWAPNSPEILLDEAGNILKIDNSAQLKAIEFAKKFDIYAITESLQALGYEKFRDGEFSLDIPGGIVVATCLHSIALCKVQIFAHINGGSQPGESWNFDDPIEFLAKAAGFRKLLKGKQDESLRINSFSRPQKSTHGFIFNDSGVVMNPIKVVLHEKGYQERLIIKLAQVEDGKWITGYEHSDFNSGGGSSPSNYKGVKKYDTQQEAFFAEVESLRESKQNSAYVQSKIKAYMLKLVKAEIKKLEIVVDGTRCSIVKKK